MKEYSVRKYNANDYTLWNEFVAEAKNATFLFHRDFMDYHWQRFQDFSLLIFDKRQKLTAIIPANVVNDEIISHQGLTYGGLVYNESLKLASVIEVFREVLYFLNGDGISKLLIKCLPSIYCLKPAEELHYALFLAFLNDKVIFLKLNQLFVLFLKMELF